MDPLFSLTVSAVCAALLAILVAFAATAFPRLPAVRWWILSWTVLGVAWLSHLASPWLDQTFTVGFETPARTTLLLAGLLAGAMAAFSWYQSTPGKDTAARTILASGAAAAALAAWLSPPGEPAATLAPGIWALVLAASPVVLTALRGVRSSEGAVRSQALGLLAALAAGSAPYALSWVVLVAAGVSAWPVGLPPLVLLGAALSLQTLIRHDHRFQPRHAQGFVFERTQDSVLFLQADGTLQAGNPAFLDLIDEDERQITGRPLKALAASPEARTLLEPLERLEVSEWEGTLEVLHRSGKPLPVHLVFRRIHNPAREAVGAVVLLYDLKNHRHLDFSSREDLVTTLANRRWVLELLEAEFQRVKRYGGPLSALWVTVDHLEDLAVQAGPEAADEVLQRLGAVLKGGLRKTDFCGRMGPADFLVALPETPTDRARLVSGRLEKMFALASEGDGLGVSLRIGAAGVEEQVLSSEEFVRIVRGAVPLPVA